VGEANVVAAMKQRRTPCIGGEGNGGVIWPRVSYVRDSLGAMALVTALLARHRRPLSSLVAEMPTYAIEKRKVDLSAKEAAAPAVAALARAYASETIDTQDGIRIDWPARRAWLHVRASNTEPIMRLIAEAPDRAQAQGILDDAARVIAGGSSRAG
jgi:phosphomannomutase